MGGVGRIRALGYGIGVSIAVFLYLGLPMLRRIYGPGVTLLAYAGIALIAGGVTYSMTRRLASRLNQTRGPTRGDTATIEVSPEEADGDDQREYYLVEQELEQLQEEE